MRKDDDWMKNYTDAQYKFANSISDLMLKTLVKDVSMPWDFEGVAEEARLHIIANCPHDITKPFSKIKDYGIWVIGLMERHFIPPCDDEESMEPYIIQIISAHRMALIGKAMQKGA